MIKIFLYEICFWKPIIITSVMAKSILPINQKRTSFLMKHYHFYNWKMFLCINSLKSRPKQLPVLAVPRHCSRKLKSLLPALLGSSSKAKARPRKHLSLPRNFPLQLLYRTLIQRYPPICPLPFHTFDFPLMRLAKGRSKVTDAPSKMDYLAGRGREIDKFLWSASRNQFSPIQLKPRDAESERRVVIRVAPPPPPPESPLTIDRAVVISRAVGGESLRFLWVRKRTMIEENAIR